MLQLYDSNHNKIEGLINYKNLKIDKELNVEDTLSFSYPVSDPKYQFIQEECYIRTSENEFVIKEVNLDDNEWTEFVCKLNLETFKGTNVDHFESLTQLCLDAVNLAIVGTGWTVGSCDVTIRRTVRHAFCMVYDILKEIQGIYGCEMAFNSITKKIYIYQSMGEDKGCYFTEQLNLKGINVQRNSYDFVTRLVPFGKDGLDIKSINGGLNYVQNNQHSNKIITAYWEDNRYSDVEALKEDAIKKLEELSKPFKSFKAQLIDLSNLSDNYDILSYGLGDTVTILSKNKNVKEKQRIIRITEYATEPEKNTCELANKTLALEVMQVDFMDTSEMLDTVTTVDGFLDGSKVDALEYARLKNVSIGETDIQNAAIVTAKIGDLAVTTAKIADLAVTTAKIDNLAVDSAQIKDAAITNAKIGNAAVDSAQIKDAAILTAKIGEAQITTAKIGDAQITTAKIGLAAVDEAQIKDAAIGTAKIQNGCIVAAKIGDAEISTAKIQNGSITTAKIGDAQITSAKIGNLEVKTANIALGAITTALIQDGAIETVQIADGSITDAKIVGLTANKITAGTLDAGAINVINLNAENITVGTINGQRIGEGTITTDKIAAGAVTGDKIEAGTIKESKLNWSQHLIF